VLEARAAARRAAAVAGVEAEHAGAVAALRRHRHDGEELPDLVERADVARRVRARRLADRALVDEHRLGEALGAEQRVVLARRLGRLAEVTLQRGEEHVLHQRALARPETPVTQTRWWSGNSTVTFFRLWSRAPLTMRRGVASPTRRFRPMPTCFLAPR
jgi:hypothetical protein